MGRRNNMKQDLKIVEGSASVYFYHASESGLSAKPALCGETKVMHTYIPITAWGCKTHINEQWCPICDKLMKDIK